LTDSTMCTAQIDYCKMLNDRTCITLAGAVARLVGIEVGVVSGVFNLESPGVSALGWRLRHEEAYHAA
jgi:hypothetical protein